MNLVIRTLLFPDTLERLNESGYVTMGRLLYNGFLRKLTEENLLNKVKAEGVAIEIYLKDVTEEEQKQYREDK